MAEEISGSSRLVLKISSSDTAGVASQSATVTVDEDSSYANGTSAGKADTAYTADGTISEAGSTTIDLDGGSLTGPLGDAQTFAEVQALYVENDGTGDLTISGDFLDLSTDSLAIPAGGKMLLECGTAGQAVTASTADEITLASTAGTSYRLAIIGRSA
jgi:hypothetical protein